MNFSIPRALESFIRKLVKSGHYGNASEVVREALRLLMLEMKSREKKLADLRRAIQKGIDSGPAVEMNIEDIIAEARRRHEQKRKRRA